MPETKLEKLKRAIDKKEAENPEEEMDARADRREQLDQIIARLKDKKKRGNTNIDRRLEELKEYVDETPVISQEETQNTVMRTKAAKEKGVNWVYSPLEKPISQISGLLTKIPFTGGLKKELAAADIRMSVETYLAVATTFALLASLAAWIIISALAVGLGDLSVPGIATSLSIGILVAIVLLFGILGFSLIYPTMIANSRAGKIEKELPFALRHLSTQVKAGVSLSRALRSVAEAQYGELTVEFNKTLTDLERGESTESALTKLANRNKSQGIKRAVVQITRAIRTGGNLAEIITSIADDISFETRMRVRDFTEMLNMISIAYIMVGVVAPVMITILSAVTQLPVFGGGIAFSLVLTVFAGVLGATCGLIFMIKRLEPV